MFVAVDLIPHEPARVRTPLGCFFIATRIARTLGVEKMEPVPAQTPLDCGFVLLKYKNKERPRFRRCFPVVHERETPILMEHPADGIVFVGPVKERTHVQYALELRFSVRVVL